VVADGESSADAADRIAYGILKRFRAPAGILGAHWLDTPARTLKEEGR